MGVLLVREVSRTFTTGETRVTALSRVSLSVAEGEFVALVGPSGCGKSTLLHICGAMDRPSSGEVSLDGVALSTLDDEGLTDLRCQRVGFVFQFFNLLPTLTVAENVAMPLLLAGARRPHAEAEARRLIDVVGLSPRLAHYPRQLSGGEMQRAAVARALVHKPTLVIADEPTGNLDSETGARIIELFVSLNRALGTTMLMATHSTDVAHAAHRVVRLRDGHIDVA